MDYWRNPSKEKGFSSAAVKLVRDIKLQYSLLKDLTKNDEKTLFYFFNYIPRLLGRALCITSINFAHRRINKEGIDYMQRTIKYIKDKLKPILQLSKLNLFTDRTFQSSEESNSINKAIRFYSVMALDREKMIEKLTQEKKYFSLEDVELLMQTTTDLRKQIPQATQNTYKKLIFGLK